MNERMFDETYNIREVLDDVIERVTLREKLLQTAKQFSDKKKEERFSLAIRQFESLMTDFLKLYQPILDRIRSYREALNKEISGLRTSLTTVNGMLEVSRGIETLAARVQRLEKDAEELDETIKEKTKTLEKIDDLMNRVRPFAGGMAGAVGGQSLGDVLGSMPKDLYGDIGDTGKEPTRKAGSRS